MVRGQGPPRPPSTGDPPLRLLDDDGPLRPGRAGAPRRRGAGLRGGSPRPDRVSYGRPWAGRRVAAASLGGRPAGRRGARQGRGGWADPVAVHAPNLRAWLRPDHRLVPPRRRRITQRRDPRGAQHLWRSTRLRGPGRRPRSHPVAPEHPQNHARVTVLRPRRPLRLPHRAAQQHARIVRVDPHRLPQRRRSAAHGLLRRRAAAVHDARHARCGRSQPGDGAAGGRRHQLPSPSPVAQGPSLPECAHRTVAADYRGHRCPVGAQRYCDSRPPTNRVRRTLKGSSR